MVMLAQLRSQVANPAWRFGQAGNHVLQANLAKLGVLGGGDRLASLHLGIEDNVGNAVDRSDRRFELGEGLKDFFRIAFADPPSDDRIQLVGVGQTAGVVTEPGLANQILPPDQAYYPLSDRL